MSKYEKLFTDFSPVSTQAWEEKIKADLKGAPYEKLFWKTIHGVTVKPFYRKEDLESSEYFDSSKGSSGVERPGNDAANNWVIREDIVVKDFAMANSQALEVLNHGATGLCFIIPDELSLSAESISQLLEGIHIDCIELSFISDNQYSLIPGLLSGVCKDRKIAADSLKGSVFVDPFSRFAREGNIGESLESDMKSMAVFIKELGDNLPKMNAIAIDTRVFHNAAASIVQELATGLSMISDYMEMMSREGIAPESLAGMFTLTFGIGSQYFPEIAKIRAARLLFRQLMESWGVRDEEMQKVSIHSYTSEWNQTAYDPYVNMLRGTTESMSAVLGGSDSLTVTGFDKSFRESNDFSKRIARNTQIILKEEAYFDKVKDPSSGSYFIESLTSSMAENAWKLFLEIEEQGGYLESLKKNFIQEMIEETAAKRDMNIATRRELLLGTNQYPNAQEMILGEYTPAAKTTQDKAEFKTMKKYRGAEAFEQLRLATEKSGKKPVVFLLTYGNLTWRKARAGFASSFFACAGYEIIDNNGFESIEEGVKAAFEKNADIIVLCSSDEEYQVSAPLTKNLINDKALLVVAGYPREILDELKNKGIQNFIHVKSNLLEELTNFNKKLGIQ